MIFARGKRVFLSLALALVVAVGAGVSTASTAHAAAWCWCTNYVANYYNLPATYPDAYQWGPWLKGLGWYEDSSPVAGDIIVIQPNVALALQGGTNWTAGSLGHVSIVAHPTYYGNSRWVIDLNGANQKWGTEYTSYNCTDVSDFNVWVTYGGNSYRYYHHP